MVKNPFVHLFSFLTVPPDQGTTCKNLYAFFDSGRTTLKLASSQRRVGRDAQSLAWLVMGFGFELCSCQPDSETDAKNFSTLRHAWILSSVAIDMKTVKI